jgi:polar amino acid transport system permease protein
MSDFLASTSPLASIALLVIGAGATLVISGVGILLGFVIAVAACGARLSKSKPLSLAGWFYISFFRGVPLLVQLMVCYYALPSLGIELPSYVAAVIALAVCTAAYQAENLRGGFLAIPKGQAEAARAFGYHDRQIFRHVLLPQALRIAMPTVVNEMIAILKASSVISVVGVADLTRVSQNIVARSQDAITWYGFAALLYLLLNFAIAWLGRLAERRLGRGVGQVEL